MWLENEEIKLTISIEIIAFLIYWVLFRKIFLVLEKKRRKKKVPSATN